MNSRFHQLAAAELAEAVAYYDTKAEGLGDRLLEEVRAAVAYIEEFPESSPVIDCAVRRKVLVKFPYDLFYAFEKSEVAILSVAHESRRPGFWRGRIS
jgi:toxin ParE1/3/4